MLAEFERLQKSHEDTYAGFPRNNFIAEGIDSQVYYFRHKRKEFVGKIYKGRSRLNFDQLSFYREITNQISQDANKNRLIIEHGNIKIPFYVLPILEIGEVKTWDRKVPFSIAEFVKGPNLAEVFIIDNRRRPKEFHILERSGMTERIMTWAMYQCEELIRDRYQVDGADLCFSNLKPHITRESISFIVTDLCTSIQYLKRLKEGY